MIRGWYYDKQHGEKYLTIDEIAAACGITRSIVQGWLSTKILKSVRAEAVAVGAWEIVSFLIRHSMPVPVSLLPPKTEKALFIANEECQFQDRSDLFDQICRYFSENCNLLVETAIAGKFADMCLFTFSPHLVVFLIQECTKKSANTLDLLSNFPEIKTVLIASHSVKKELLLRVEKFPDNCLFVSADLTSGYLFPLLRQTFEK